MRTRLSNHRIAETGVVRIGLVADDERRSGFVDAIRECGRLELAAHAGLSQVEALDGVPWHDDPRDMIARADIDAVILATSTHEAIALAWVALEHGLHCWRPAPLGRNFAEAIEVAARVRGVAPVFRVASWWELAAEPFRAAIRVAAEFWPVFSEIRIACAGPTIHSWRSGAVEAGGGVLAGDAYDMLEALIALRKLPSAAFGIAGKYRRRSAEPPRETEDLAAAILHYEGGGTAIIRASWDMIPEAECISWHHDAERTLELTPASVRMLAPNAAVLSYAAIPQAHLLEEMRRFAADVAEPDGRRDPEPTIERHLAVSSLLEAIYLSARTTHPEAPRDLYSVQGWREPRP